MTTIRKFKQQKITRELIEYILNITRKQPTGMNKQPVRFMIVLNNLDFVFINVKWGSYLEEGTPKDDERPVAYIVLFSTEDAKYDVGIAAHSIINEAWKYGIGSCIMGSVDKNIIKVKGLNTDLVIALGLPAQESSIIKYVDSNKYFEENGKIFVPKLELNDVIIDEISY